MDMSTMSDQSLESHVERINSMIVIIASIPGNVINYIDAAETVKYLSILRDEYKKELRRRAEKGGNDHGKSSSEV